MKEFVEQAKALGDITRLKIVRLMMESRQDLCVCEIMDALEVSHSNVSRHLKILKTAGFVRERREGRWVHFHLTEPGSPFHKYLLLAVGNLPAEHLAADIERMHLRLSLREGGRCVEGVKSGKWGQLLSLDGNEEQKRFDERLVERKAERSP